MSRRLLHSGGWIREPTKPQNTKGTSILVERRYAG